MTATRGRWWVTLFLLVLLGPRPAWAHALLEAAKDAYGNGDFSIALARLAEVDRDPKLTLEEKASLLWYRALTQQALGQASEATATWDSLVALAPLHEPSSVDASPVQKAGFEARRALYLAHHRVTLDAVHIVGARVTATLRGPPGEAAAGTLFMRQPGQPTYRALAMTVAEGGVWATLSDEALWPAGGATWELVVEANNAAGSPVARVGNAAAPVRLTVTPAQSAAALDALRGPPLPVATPNPEAPPAPPPSRAWPVAGGALAVASTVAVLAVTALAGASTVCWALLWVVPRKVGEDKAPAFRGLYGGWLGLLAATVAVAAVAIPLGAAAWAGWALWGAL